MYDIPKAIQAFFEALKQAFSYAETSKNKQCETDVLKTKKKLNKKSDKQEDLLLDMAYLIEKYMVLFSKPDRIRARVYLKRIKRVN